MRLLVAGSGKMAEALHAECDAQNIGTQVFVYDESLVDAPVQYDEWADTIGIYLGSPDERKLSRFCGFCGPRFVPLMQCVGGVRIMGWWQGTFVLVPNASLLGLAFMRGVYVCADSLKGQEVEWIIRESHQSGKIGPSWTDTELAEVVGLPKEKIILIRDPEQQRALGVPNQYLGAHGYHWVTARTANEVIQHVCKIHGRQGYAQGMIEIAKKMQEKRSDLHVGSNDLALFV